jgi:hypothetical protein
MEKILRDRRVYELLEEVDRELALKAKELGCEHCGGRLHRGDYPRKARGGADWDNRYSFCCSREGCRKRKTPRSVRFLGRKVYVGVVVVLVSAMMHGLNEGRVKRLRQELGMDRRTLTHWRGWWREKFVQGRFWRGEKGRFRRPIREEQMPLGLVEAFGAWEREGLLKLMKFLSSITTLSCKGVSAM